MNELVRQCYFCGNEKLASDFKLSERCQFGIDQKKCRQCDADLHRKEYNDGLGKQKKHLYYMRKKYEKMGLVYSE